MANLSDKEIVDWILSCRREADEAKTDRKVRNRENSDMFHLRYDFSHKRAGQSKEILSGVQTAVIQTQSFYEQALADSGDWWEAKASWPDADKTLPVRPAEITKLTNHMLEQGGYYAHVGNTVQAALLHALGISKCYAKMVPKPKFVSMKKGKGKGLKRWVDKVDDETVRVVFENVRAENFYPDPTKKKLYVIEDMWVDMHEVMELAGIDEDSDGDPDEAIYDRAAVETLSTAMSDEDLQEFKKARETGQNTTSEGHRPKVKITEFWGTILDKTTGRVCYENCVATIANDSVLIRHPKGGNPLWHQGNPYTYSPLLEVANSEWHVALMDAPVMHNRARIEMYNLMTDAGMESVHSIKQLRKDALDNPAQVANGIKPGSTLTVNSMLPVGGKVLEALTTTQIPGDAFNLFNIQTQEFNSSAMTSDARMGMSNPDVSATATIESSQTITSVSKGIAKKYEQKQITPEIQLAWMTVAQNWSSIDKETFISLFGAQRGTELSQLSPEDVFASTVNGLKFRVYGISMTLARTQEFQKLTTMMQTVFSAPPLTEAFMTEYDPKRLLGKMLDSLNIDKYSIELPLATKMTMPSEQQAPEQGANPQAGPDQMSQVADPMAGGAISDMMGGDSNVVQPGGFPGSPAVANAGGQ